MNFKSYLSLGAASIAVLAGAGAANAAALQGRVGINPPSNQGQSGVIFRGTGIEVPAALNPDTPPLTDFDFVPPNNGGVGAVVEINANPFQGSNDFLPFVNQTGTIKDVTAEQLLATVGFDTSFNSIPEVDIPEFINLPGSFSFTLESTSFPQYTFTPVNPSNLALGGDTTVSIGVTGTFINLSDGSLDESDGVGTFSVDFAGKTIAETQALFDEPGEVPIEFNPGTWSSNFVAVENNIPTVPEASNLLGLLVIGLGGASMLIRKKQA